MDTNKINPVVPAAPASVPGVRSGTAPVEKVAGANAPDTHHRIPADPHATVESIVAKSGNKGGRTRLDGLVPGSPAAKQADKDADAKRKRDDRAAKAAQRTVENPIRIQVATPTPEPGGGPSPAPGGDVLLNPVAPTGQWVAADFAGVAPQVIDMLELWAIESDFALATEAKLSTPVIAKIKIDAAFPPKAKSALSGSSPEFLAVVFNTLHVPLAIKPYLVSAPMAVYIVIDRLAKRRALHELIASERKISPATPQTQTAVS